MVGKMDGTILPATQGITFIRRRRSWKRGPDVGFQCPWATNHCVLIFIRSPKNVKIAFRNRLFLAN